MQAQKSVKKGVLQTSASGCVPSSALWLTVVMESNYMSFGLNCHRLGNTVLSYIAVWLNDIRGRIFGQDNFMAPYGDNVSNNVIKFTDSTRIVITVKKMIRFLN